MVRRRNNLGFMTSAVLKSIYIQLFCSTDGCFKIIAPGRLINGHFRKTKSRGRHFAFIVRVWPFYRSTRREFGKKILRVENTRQWDESKTNITVNIRKVIAFHVRVAPNVNAFGNWGTYFLIGRRIRRIVRH